MNMDQLRDHLLQNQPDLVQSPEDFNSKVTDQCNEICRLVFETIKDKLERKF